MFLLIEEAALRKSRKRRKTPDEREARIVEGAYMRTEGRFFALLLGFALITDCVAVSSPNSKTTSPQSPDLCLARRGRVVWSWYQVSTGAGLLMTKS